jgi:phosphatidylinositol glycan class V
MLFIVLCGFVDILLPDHVPYGVETIEGLTNQVSFLARPFLKWDAVHYLKIALYGYQRDYQYAFFPLLPGVLFFGNQLFAIQSINTLVIFNLSVNIVIHACLVVLLKLILDALPFVDPQLRRLSLLVHIFSPSTVFFTSLYTESLFALCTWYAIYLYFIQDNILLSVFPFFVASCVRSNGALNVFIILGDISWKFSTRPLKLNHIFDRSLTIKIIICILIVLPAMLWQWYAFQNICDSHSVMIPQYCASTHIWKIYSAIQFEYWNVGFLKFYQWRQIPNIAIGLPAIVLSCRYLYSTYNVLQNNSLWLARLFISLGVHLLVNTIVVATFAHVNISTRVLSSCSPLFAVAVAYSLTKNTLTWCYIIGYFGLGAILHCNNFPWT